MISSKKTAAAPSMPSPAQGESRSLGERAYRQIWEAIQQGRLLPGTRMREVEIAQWLGISRTPVREALARLVSEGLAVNDAQRGMVIAELDQRAVGELYIMRETLEARRHGLPPSMRRNSRSPCYARSSNARHESATMPHNRRKIIGPSMRLFIKARTTAI